MWKLRIIVSLMSAVGASAVTSGAHAWGDIGHKTVCEIAMAKVKPSTRAAIIKLINADGEFESFSDACTWPDHPRKRAEEHFVNLARDASALTNNCGVAPKCVVTAIAKDFAVLSSNTATADQKAASRVPNNGQTSHSKSPKAYRPNTASSTAPAVIRPLAA